VRCSVHRVGGAEESADPPRAETGTRAETGEESSQPAHRCCFRMRLTMHRAVKQCAGRLRDRIIKINSGIFK